MFKNKPLNLTSMYQSRMEIPKIRGFGRHFTIEKVASLRQPTAIEYDIIFDAIAQAETRLLNYKRDLRRPDLMYTPFRNKEGVIQVRVGLLENSDNPFNLKSELPPYFDLLIKAYSSIINGILKRRREYPPTNLSTESLEFILIN